MSDGLTGRHCWLVQQCHGCWRSAPRWVGRALLLGASIVAAFQSARAQDVWDLTPCRVRMLARFESAPEFTPRFVSTFSRRVGERVEGVVGAPWQFELQLVSREVGGRLPGPLAVEAPAEPPFELTDPGLDKVLLLDVTVVARSYQVSVRDWDVRTRTLGTVVRRDVATLSRLAEAVFEAALEAFCPLARITGVDRTEARLRILGGALPTVDPTLSFDGGRQVFEPVLRTTNRDGEVRRISKIPWTLLGVRESSGAERVCKVWAGVRSPLGSRSRARVEKLAIAVRDPQGTTRLVLRATGDVAKPLVGYDVLAHAVDSREPQSLGATDERGAIWVSAGDDALRILLVRHGGEVLARLPLVPGVRSELTAELPDDAERLRLEGVLLGLQERVVDLVARRKTLVARIRQRLERGERAPAQALLKELQGMDSGAELGLALRQQQQRLNPRDVYTARRAKRLFETTEKAISRFLGLQEQLDVERSLAVASRAIVPQGTAPQSPAVESEASEP